MDLSNLSYAVLCCVTLVIGWLLHWTYRWMPPPPCKGRLPPGSMGFPIIGETFQYMKISPSMDVPSFFRQRLKRQQTPYSARRASPYSRASCTSSSAALRPSFLAMKSSRNRSSELEDAIKLGFAAWAAKPSIEVKDAIADMVFDLVAKKIIGIAAEESKELRKNYQDFFKVVLCFPIYFPGTTFYKCMKGKRNVEQKLTQLLKHRLNTPEKKHGDLLDCLVEELQSEKPLIDETFSIHALSGLLFGSFITISGTLTVGLKLLKDNPEVVETLKEEHESILKKREDMNSGLTWEEYKSMTFTAQVINEITRIGNIGPGIFRKTLTDVQVNGYTIPAGWLVMISPMVGHLSPTLFDDPLKFNPWRWTTEDKEKQSIQQRNWMPFGGGTRQCLGADFSKLFISLFLHVLVPNYRWIGIKGGEVSRIGEMVVPHDYLIELVAMR